MIIVREVPTDANLVEWWPIIHGRRSVPGGQGLSVSKMGVV
jgi:hypothetical protein